MKCCSVSVTLLHIITAVSAVMVLAATSYALESDKWMQNDSLSTKDNDGVKAYQGLHQTCLKFSINGRSSTSCSDSAVLAAAALGSYGVHIRASNDSLAGGDGGNLDDDAKWKPANGTDALAGALAMSMLGSVSSLLASLAACSCLPQGCCVKGSGKKQEPLLG